MHFYMLEDFIQSNQLKSKVFALPEHKTLQDQLKEKSIPFSSIIECQLFLSNKREPIFFIASHLQIFLFICFN